MNKNMPRFLYRLEKTELAIADANKALELKEENTKANAAKAEALFSSGNFEQALALYEKVSRMVKSEDMKAGLKKSRQAILNVIGTGAMEFDEKTVAIVIEDLEKKEKRQKHKEFKIPRNKQVTKHPRKVPRARLNISNVLKEEELFLKQLRDIEKFNLKINVRRGTRRAPCQV